MKTNHVAGTWAETIVFTLTIIAALGLAATFLSDKPKVPYPQLPTTQTQLEDSFRDYCSGNGGHLSSFNSVVKDNTLVLQCGKLGKLELPIIPIHAE